MVKLLVIGGGMAGCSAVVGLRKLDKEVEIVLVEPKDHCEIYWAAYRSPFEPWVANGSLCTLKAWTDKYKVQHIRSTVSKLTPTSALLANGDTIDYDVAVVATGAATKAPLLGRGVPSDDGTKASRMASMKEHGDKLLNAKSVLIVGGGLIGTELAGDLAKYAKMKGKDVKVTLVHSGPHLSHVELPEPTGRWVQQKLEKLGVKVILNDKVVESNGKCTLEGSGESIDADEVVMTTGLVSVNDFLKDEFALALNDKGFVEADEYFRLPGGNGKLFSFGDCSTFLPNAGYQLMDNGPSIGKNIKLTLDALAKGEAPPAESALVKGKSSYQITLNTVGPKDGVFYTPAFSTQWFLPWVKNKTMFFFRLGELGLSSK